MSVGIVLEGGGMRGLYTAGVLDQLLEEEIKVDGMVTVSAGALFGMNYASKQRGRALRYNKKYINDKRYISVRSFLQTGNMINKEFAYHTVPFELDKFDQEAFARSGIDFYATATNVETGEPEYFQITNGFQQIEALRASGSIPFVSQIVSYDGGKYLDGGVSDSIPIYKAKKLGYEKIIVVLTRPQEYRKIKPVSPRMIDLFYRSYPEFANRLKTRYQEYNEMLEHIIHLEQNGELFVIRPSQNIPIKILEQDPEKLQTIYDLGMNDAQAEMKELKKYLFY